MPQAPEYATASRFYFEAGNVKAPVKEFSNIGIDAPPTEHNIPLLLLAWERILKPIYSKYLD